MNVRNWIKTLLGIQPKKTFRQGIFPNDWSLRYVAIDPLSGINRTRDYGRQTVAVITLSSFDGAPESRTEWVLLPFEFWSTDDSAESVGQDVKLPADDLTSYGGTSDE